MKEIKITDEEIKKQAKKRAMHYSEMDYDDYDIAVESFEAGVKWAIKYLNDHTNELLSFS